MYFENVKKILDLAVCVCIKCGKCEKVCPQHLQIRNLLEKVAGEFEKLA